MGAQTQSVDLEPAADVVAGDVSGGSHTSRTIMLDDLSRLLRTLPDAASFDDYAAAIIDDNALGKSSLNSRQRSLRYLRELYLLDPNRLLFRALRDLWDLDSGGRPLLAMLSALARDPALRATAESVVPAPVGSSVTSHDLGEMVQKRFDHSYADSVANKIGRNAASSWTQSGHLEGRTKKVRVKALTTPGPTAYALMLGHLTGERGHGLFNTVWARTLDATPTELHGSATAASTRGWIDYKRFGDVVEVGFKWLLRDSEVGA